MLTFIIILFFISTAYQIDIPTPTVKQHFLTTHSASTKCEAAKPVKIMVLENKCLSYSSTGLKCEIDTDNDKGKCFVCTDSECDDCEDTASYDCDIDKCCEYKTTSSYIFTEETVEDILGSATGKKVEGIVLLYVVVLSFMFILF